jgi:hypothetical protein
MSWRNGRVILVSMFLSIASTGCTGRAGSQLFMMLGASLSAQTQPSEPCAISGPAGPWAVQLERLTYDCWLYRALYKRWPTTLDQLRAVSMHQNDYSAFSDVSFEPDGRDLRIRAITVPTESDPPVAVSFVVPVFIEVSDSKAELGGMFRAVGLHLWLQSLRDEAATRPAGTQHPATTRDGGAATQCELRTDTDGRR